MSRTETLVSDGSTTGATGTSNADVIEAPQISYLRTAPPTPDPTASLWRLGQAQSSVGGSPTAGFHTLERASVLRPEDTNVSRSPLTLNEPTRAVAPPARLNVLQKWEGIILDITDDQFSARLIDLTGGRPDQEAMVHIEEISPRDRRRVVPGALFYWYIGYRDEPSGDRERLSRIRLRRLPSLTEVERTNAHDAAERLRRRLGWSR